MITRCVVAAVLVAALAGFIKQNEASEYGSTLTKLDNWLLNHPDRPKNNQWWNDLDFIWKIAKSRTGKRKYPLLSDQKVKDLLNLYPSDNGVQKLKCSSESLPILKDLIAIIGGSSERDGPLSQAFTIQLIPLKQCYYRLLLNNFGSDVASALDESGRKSLGPLSGPEIKNQFDGMNRQKWIDHLFDHDIHDGLKGARVAKFRLRKGEDPFKTDGLLHAITLSLYPGARWFISYIDERAGADGVVKFTKAQAMDYFEKNIKKPCESYVRAARPLVDPAARILEERDDIDCPKLDFGGEKMAYWYLVCEVVVEMKFTEEMADAIVKELEERHNRFKKTFGFQQ